MHRQRLRKAVATSVVVVFVDSNKDLSNAVDQSDSIDVVPILHFNVGFSQTIPATHTSALGLLILLCTLQFTIEPELDLITGDSVSDAQSAKEQGSPGSEAEQPGAT